MTVIPQAAANDPEESDLIQSCRDGDRIAFRRLYELHYRRVHRTAACLGTPAGELDDVTQEVFTSAFSKLDRFQGGNFGHWLHRICANVVTDHHRRRRVREGLRRLLGMGAPDLAPEPQPDVAAARAQAQEQVAVILSRMRPKQREVFALFELEGLSGEEIAQRVGCPVNTVWTRLHHARAAFVRLGKKRGFIDTEVSP